MYLSGAGDITFLVYQNAPSAALMAALQPSLLSVESLPEFTSSDVALGVTLSPRGNELAVHTALVSLETLGASASCSCLPSSVSEQQKERGTRQ